MGPPQYMSGVGHHSVHHPSAHAHQHLGGGATVMVGAGGAPGYAAVVHSHHSQAPAFQPQQPHHTRFRKSKSFFVFVYFVFSQIDSDFFYFTLKIENFLQLQLFNCSFHSANGLSNASS